MQREKDLQDIVKGLVRMADSKILLFVLDGLGGLPRDGKTELEAANTPNLDSLAARSECGMHIPVVRGITPGSGAAHLGIFGYDPLKYTIGRGVLEALGLGVDLGPRDIAVRGNFATVRYSEKGPVVVDRRAGRIPSEESKKIVEKISRNIHEIEGVSFRLYPGMEHRFVLVLTLPEGINVNAEELNDTDPQLTALSPLKIEGKSEESKWLASIVNIFIDEVSRILSDEKMANYILLRGFSSYPNLRSYEELYGLKSACIATYPMYRGVSKLVGMDILETKDVSIASEIDTLEKKFSDYDFFYIHIKKTDSYGEDGNFEAKVKVIEEFDNIIPRIIDLSADVIAVTGDHSTPSLMKSHSWHPVPLLIYSKNSRGYKSSSFSEKECRFGDLGYLKSIEIMPLLLAHAGRLAKYGA